MQRMGLAMHLRRRPAHACSGAGRAQTLAAHVCCRLKHPVFVRPQVAKAMYGDMFDNTAPRKTKEVSSKSQT